MKQLHLLEREIQESTDELNGIKPSYEKKVQEEDEITKRYEFIWCNNIALWS